MQNSVARLMEVEPDVMKAWVAGLNLLAQGERTMQEMIINPPFPVIMEDEIIHTPEQPFCSDEKCPCHHDHALHQQYCFDPYIDGLLTMAEARRFFYGRQV